MMDGTPKDFSDARAFDTGNTVFLSDVVTRIKTELEGNQRRDALSAFKALEKQAGVDLSDTPATAVTLRPILAGLNASTPGISPKRLANIRSLVTQAVARFGMQRRWITKDIELAPAWLALMEQAPKREYRWSLSRLACYCTVVGVAPADVSPNTLLGLHAALEADCTVTKPRGILKQTISIWNMCRKNTPDWPQQKLSSPFRKEPYMFKLEDFPESFQEEVEIFCRYLRTPDPLDPHAPLRAYRPATIDGYVLTFRRLASALVHTNTLAQVEVSGLAVLCAPDHLKAALRPYLPEGANRTYEYPHKMAVQISFVASQYLRVDEEAIASIRLIASRLGKNLTSGMGKRNKSRLAPFDDPAIVRRLLSFPRAEQDRALRKTNPKRRAKGIERTLLASLLINTGLRVQSLRRLQHAKHFRVTPREVFLELEEEDTKTHSAQSLSLPAESVCLLDLFLKEHRKLLPGADGPYLFPGERGGMRHASSLRNAVGPHIKTHLGIDVSPHLFRHFVAKIVMERDPGMLADVSRRLGHKSINTTYGTYLGTETLAASRRINALLEDMRGEAE